MLTLWVSSKLDLFSTKFVAEGRPIKKNHKFHWPRCFAVEIISSSGTAITVIIIIKVKLFPHYKIFRILIRKQFFKL